MAFPRKDGVAVETVVFNGYKYNRYPSSKNPAHRRYFSRTGHRLHRDVWEFHNGPIPDGHQIHHVDGDTGNNDIANLECLAFKAHRAEHHEGYVERGKTNKQLAHLSKIQEMAKEWHKSDAGREWHRKNAYNTIQKEGAPKPYSKSHYTGICDWCGTPFEAKSPQKTNCSSVCVSQKSKYLQGKRCLPHPHYAARLQHDG